MFAEVAMRVALGEPSGRELAPALGQTRSTTPSMRFAGRPAERKEW